jgi:heat shock protein HslJ
MRLSGQQCTKAIAIGMAVGPMLTACQPAPQDSSPTHQQNVAAVVELNDTRWQLVELISTDGLTGAVRPGDPNRYLLYLHSDGTATLNLDCNVATGPWSSVNSAEGISGVFSIGPASMTRALCLPDSLDQRIANELKYIRSYVVKDGRLNLRLMNGGVQI